MRIYLILICSMFIYCSLYGQNYNNNICGNTITFVQGESVNIPFVYQIQAVDPANMNGMNGPIRRPRRFSATTLKIKEDRLLKSSTAITQDSNYVNIGNLTTSATTCGDTNGSGSGEVNFSFEWNDPFNDPLWSQFAEPDGQTFIIEFGDLYNPSSTLCNMSELFKTEDLRGGGTPNYSNSCALTLIAVPSSASSAIPTLGEWGLILLSISMLIIGLVVIRVSSYSFSSNS